MAIERALVNAIQKPWGVTSLLPWSRAGIGDLPIGEIWFERASGTPTDCELLLKLLFTSQPLSIQVHPGDSYANSIGLKRGKSEAWYILDAVADAKVALGLQHPLSASQLESAIGSGSIVDHVAWQDVKRDDVVVVPAGTIHAIGAGLVVAEIQQRADATFRLFDFGRERELHATHAIAVAHREPAPAQSPLARFTKERTILAANDGFIFERLDLLPMSDWLVEADRETWLLVLSGSAVAGAFDVVRGEAIFAQSDQFGIRAGSDGLTCLAAYTGAGGPAPRFLQRITEPCFVAESGSEEVCSSASPRRPQALATSAHDGNQQ